MNDFTAQVAQLTQGMRYRAAGGGSMFNPGELAEKELPRLRGSALFAYLFRRFGYPDTGWDDYKELVHYRITTPMQDVFLEITPYMGGDFPEKERRYDSTALMFGYCIPQSIEKAFSICIRQNYDAWDAHPLRVAVNEALIAALRDLLRPVFIRDVPINCYGAMDDIADDREDDEEENPIIVPAYHAAGYPIVAALLEDTKRYEQFIDALQTCGGGDIGKGMEMIIKRHV